MLNSPTSDTYRFASAVPRRLGYVVWGVLGLLAIFFFRERALFTDAAFQNFQMLQSEAIYIAHDRFGNAIPQFLPWLVMKLGGSLRAILLTYSLSFILFFTGIYWLLVNRLRNDYLGWSLILYYLLLAYDSFFHVQSELYQSTAWLLVFFGIVLYRPRLDRGWQWGALTVIAVLLAFYHKLSIVFFLFLWVYFILLRPGLRGWRYAGTLVLVIAIVLLKSYGWESPYEAGRMDILQQALQDYFPNFWDIPANGKFLRKCIWYYPLFPIVLVAVTVFYLRQRTFLRLAFMLAATLGYILLVHYSSPNTSYRFYAEVTYRGLGLIVGVPLLFEVLPRWHNRQIAIVLGVVVLLRIGPIMYNGFQFQERLEWMDNTLDAARQTRGGSLFRLYTSEVPDLIITDWAVPYESLLLTALESPSRQATLFLDDDFLEVYEKLSAGDIFLSRFEQLELDQLNPRFFHLQHGLYHNLSAPIR